MKTQTKIITYLIVILMLLQPLMVTIAYATEETETVTEVTQNNGILSITISDEALYGALKENLKNMVSYLSCLDADQTIRIKNNDLEKVTKLVLEDRNISDLSGIENFTYLEYLDLSGNNLTENSNLDKVNALTKLTYLDLSRNQIKDISKDGSNITGLLNTGIDLDLDQDLKVVDFIKTPETPDTPEEIAEAILANKKEEIILPQILFAYNNENCDHINVASLKVDGNIIEKSDYADYIKIKDQKIIFETTTDSKYEIELSVSDIVPNNKTRCSLKVFRIEAEQEGIVFKDRNLYTAIKEKYEDASTKGTEWYGKGLGTWVFDGDDLIIIALQKDLQNITTADLSIKSITDLTGIEKFIGLNELNLADNRIISVAPLQDLNKNKQLSVEKLDAYIEKLTKLLDEYNEINSQISSIEADSTLTASEIKKEVATLSYKLDTRLSAMRKVLMKINNLDGTGEAISKLLSGYLVRENILEVIEKFENLQLTTGNINTLTANLSKEEQFNYIVKQIEAIKNYRISDMADKLISVLGNGLTKDEFDKLISTNISYILDSTISIETVKKDTDIDVDIKTDKIWLAEDKEIAMAKEAIELLVSNTTTDNVSIRINKYNASDIVTKSLGTTIDTTDKSESTLLTEFKNALNSLISGIDSKTKAEYITKYYCTDLKLTNRDTLLNLAKDKFNISLSRNIKYYIELSTNAISAINEKIGVKNWNSGKIQYKEFITDNNNLITQIIEEYKSYEGVLTTVKNVLVATDYAGLDVTDVVILINRLQNLTTEEKSNIDRFSELTVLNLAGNSIGDASGLADFNSLSNLNLSDNVLSEFDFSKFQKVETLDVSRNKIREVEITEMIEIEELNLSKNWISSVDKITLSGMPKLQRLNINENKIEDVGNLLEQKNDFLLKSGYNKLSKYITEGNGDTSQYFRVAGQIIEKDLGKIFTTASEVTYNLPPIFEQVKSLMSSNLSVEYDWSKPCTKVFLDEEGAKYILDTTTKNSNKEATITMTSTGTSITDVATFIVNYIVIDDKVEPKIDNIKFSTEDWTNGDVTVTVEASDADTSVELYSFNNGTTWKELNSEVFTENKDGIIIKVQDLAGNIYTHEPIKVTNIDKTAPNIAINTTILDKDTGKSSVTILVEDTESGLNPENKYEYYISTSKDDKVGGEWTAYEPGKAFEIGEGLDGTFYMFIKQVSDKVGNESEEKEAIEVKFTNLDTTPPTIKAVNGIPTDWTNENVTLTVEAEDTESGIAYYSFDGGKNWQKSNSKEFTERTEVKICVIDKRENEAQYKYKDGETNTEKDIIDIKIDKKAPTVNVGTVLTKDGKVEVTVSAKDEESLLNQNNEYKYGIAKTNDEEAVKEWKEYTLDTKFEIGDGLEDGIYYLFIKEIKDNVNNSEKVSATEIKIGKAGVLGEKGEILTLDSITSIVRAYITEDYSNLSEDLLSYAGEDGKFDINEVTKAIRVYLIEV